MQLHFFVPTWFVILIDQDLLEETIILPKSFAYASPKVESVEWQVESVEDSLSKRKYRKLLIDKNLAHKSLQLYFIPN